MEKKIIINRLEEIFNSLFNIQFQKLPIELYDKALLGREFNLSSTDLLCLYMEIEKQFKISIPQEEVGKGNFNSINNIINIIAFNL